MIPNMIEFPGGGKGLSSTSKSETPTPRLTTSTPLIQVLLRVYGYLGPYWKHTAGAYASLLGILALNALIPQFIRWTIDTGIDGKQPNILVWAVLALLALTILKVSLIIIKEY